MVIRDFSLDLHPLTKKNDPVQQCCYTAPWAMPCISSRRIM